jgi:hypothetical protein
MTIDPSTMTTEELNEYMDRAFEDEIPVQVSAGVSSFDNLDKFVQSLGVTENDALLAQKHFSEERALRMAAQANENARLTAEAVATVERIKRKEKLLKSPTAFSAEITGNAVPLLHGSTLTHALDTQPCIEVSPSAALVEKPSSSEAPYSFPISMDSFDCLVVGNLVARMTRLVVDCKAHGDYMLIRDEYCSLAVALNREGLMAPAFRPAPIIPKLKERRTATNMMLHRDSLVIDCHWLHCRCENVYPRDDEHKPLFDIAAPFQFELAASFACKVWSKLHRADEAFVLTTWQQCQMRTMKGVDVSDRLVAAKNSSGRGEYRVRPKIVSVKRAMREWCNRDKRLIPLRQCYEDLWLARELLGTSGSMTEIALLGGFITGVRPSNERTVRGKLKRLDEHMTGGKYGGMSVASAGACSGASEITAGLQAT